jgi:plastocyanin
MLALAQLVHMPAPRVCPAHIGAAVAVALLLIVLAVRPAGAFGPDVNNDGQATAVDALCVLRNVAGLDATAACPSPLPNPDVNGDGLINPIDSLCVLRWSAGLPQTAACPLTTATTATVDVIDNDYAPRAIVIRTGARVTWTNRGAAPHTVTGEGNPLNSPLFGGGGQYDFVFTTAGSFTYYCAIHAGMVGQVVVRVP